MGPSSEPLGWVVWLTGRPSSGKTTLAWRIRRALRKAGVTALVLDGDQVRNAIVPTPGYTRKSRERFYATLALLAAMLARQGFVVLVPATANRRAYRQRAKELAPRFLEVYVAASAEACAQRDVKGLYAAARRGRVRALPGAGTVYEESLQPDVRASGGFDPSAVSEVVDWIGRGRPRRPKRKEAA